MLFVWIAISAYLLFAINGIVDKFLLTRAVRHPVAYAFFIGITGPLTWILAPFGLRWVSFPDFFIALVGGACFVLALYFLYVATQETSISRLLPVEGGLVPVFTLIFAYTFLGERLEGRQWLAFIFLVVGAVLVAFRREKTGWHASALGNSIVAAILFALSFVLTKYIFDATNFVSGLIWTRLGFFVVALAFLLPEKNRAYIFNAPKQTTTGNKFLYYGARVSGGVAGLLQNYAIAAGSVIIVNALQGVQYAFLLVMTIFLSKYYPKILKEKITPFILFQKILAIFIITLGLVFLVI